MPISQTNSILLQKQLTDCLSSLKEQSSSSIQGQLEFILKLELADPEMPPCLLCTDELLDADDIAKSYSFLQTLFEPCQSYLIINSNELESSAPSDLGLLSPLNSNGDYDLIVAPIHSAQKELIGFCYLKSTEKQENVLQSLVKQIQSLAHILERMNLLLESFSHLIEPMTDSNTELKPEDIPRQSLLISENKRLKKQLKSLEQHAQIDPLTGLLNRAFFEEHFELLLHTAKRNNQTLVIVLIDLDDFKKINDTLGHKAGDKLLKTVARRLKDCARKSDVVARLGGDEFVLIINNPISKQSALEVIARILAEVSSSVQLEHRKHIVSCSIGFSVYPDDAQSRDELLKYADSAMYQAKRKGKGKFQYYSENLQQEIQQRVELETELRDAVDHGDFVLYYQPQMDMRTGKTVGMEALIRWQHADRGIISPLKFIPLAEEIGLILSIGDWVIEQACEQLAFWKSKNIPVHPISVNLSVKQLSQPDLAEHIQSALDKHKVPANLITIEITESLSLDTAEEQLETLNRIKSVGVGISIDDFGTGYSNLNYLKKYPIDEIKIDKSFVDEITSDPHDKAIATTIIAIAHNLSLRVVAEGVETKEQLSVLAKNGCDILQGYYYSQPLPEREMTKLLEDNAELDLTGIRPSDYQRTILIVDDEKNILSSLKRLFRKSGAKVLTAGSAKQALEIMALNEVGIILSDLSMPKTNGIELLQLVQELYPYTVRMILSGKSEFESARDAINKSSIHKFITKPWTGQELLDDVEQAFRKYESQFY
jgi:diguanylate cyclase (GGDEF)-like protein